MAHDPNKLRELLFSAAPLSFIPTYDMEWVMKELNKLAPNSTVLEIGTFIAGTTRILALARPDITIYSVDINDWVSTDTLRNDVAQKYSLDYVSNEDLRNMQKINVEDCPNVRLLSMPALDVELDNIDLLFVDGDHGYQAVLQELRYFWDKVAVGGIVMGDDIQSADVYDAVRVFSFEQDLEYAIYSKSFKMVKNPILDPIEHQRRCKERLDVLGFLLPEGRRR